MNAAKSSTPGGVPASDIRALGLPRDEYEPGTFINDKLELIARRGRGGMGEVWVARHHMLEIDVAVKVIRADRVSPAASSRLLREARSAARVSHPAITRVLDIGRTAELEPYIVMELLEGRSLSELLAREGRLPSLQAVRLLLPIAHALAAAHKKAIIHRDLKPENVFLSVGDDCRPQPKLLDFGIAFSASPERITAKHRVVATPEYAAPEQVRGERIPDERADIWAFSVVLYECITGERPFIKTVEDGAGAELPPFKASAISEAELRAIVERGLAFDPNSRWTSMTELGHALAEWLIRAGIHEDITGTLLRASWPHASAASMNQPEPSEVSVKLEDGWPTRPSLELARVSEFTTLDMLLPVHPSRAEHEPSLIAPRPSTRPAPPEPRRSSLPAGGNSRFRLWGLYADLQSSK